MPRSRDDEIGGGPQGGPGESGPGEPGYGGGVGVGEEGALEEEVPPDRPGPAERDPDDGEAAGDADAPAP